MRQINEGRILYAVTIKIPIAIEAREAGTSLAVARHSVQPVLSDVAYEERWGLRRVLLNVDLFGTFHPREILRLALALQRHYASGGMRPHEVMRVYMALGLLGNSIGVTCAASGATTTPPKPKSPSQRGKLPRKPKSSEALKRRQMGV
ncbi:hypothetical protein MTO96_051646 [Rhipicephalus appendiculatus]